MKRHPDFILAVAGAACASLMIVRWFAVFRDGPYVFTSGAEGESLFAIWKWMHGEKVFAYPFDQPFAISYFNWMFYWTYGAFASGVSYLLKLEPSALPSVARSLTVLLTLVSGVLVYALLDPLDLLRRIAGSVVVALNPLIGFWSVTTRPDIAALVCDLAGLWCVKKADRSGSIWLMPALVAFYGAWAFKQSFVAALTAACLYLFISGRRKQAFLLGGGSAIAFGATLAFGDADYRYALLWSQSGMWLSASVAFHNCLWAFLKAPLFTLGLVSILASIRKVHLNLLALTGLISFALMLPASGKIGASDNYFLESAAACSVIFLLACSERRVFAGAFAQIVPVGLIFAGLTGLPAAKPEPELALLKQTLAEMTGPVIVTTGDGNLPWFQEKPPHFLLASTYGVDRLRRKLFAFDGVAGMIRTGLIKVLVCPRTEVDKPFDGIVPGSLRKIREDSYWAYFDTAAGG
jgi:Dolichyl-phosphate-mannose-protein mannosyltransferase